MSLTPQAFVAKWRAVSLSERSSYQQHFLDLCELVNHPKPAELDPTGTSFTFEAGVKQQSGRQGWADVWKKGFFALEYKGKHADLTKAYEQLLKYRENLQNPPLLIVCDLDTIVIHTNFTNTVKQVVTLTYEDLLTSKGLTTLRNVFYDPDAFKAPKTTTQVTEDAAREFAKLAELLRKWGEAPDRIAHFLIRLLFCLFAEDTGILPNDVFSRLVKSNRTNPSRFSKQLELLFTEMSTGGYFSMEEIPHVNGKLFDDATVLELTSDGMEILARVSTLDWSSIEPVIFGTLFERSLDPAKRAPLGIHYTSRDDILLIVEPVLMAPLRRKWEAIKAQVANKKPKDLQKEVMRFADELASVRVLDPACGSGNFLYVALKQLLDLEKEVITFAADSGIGGFFPQVSPEQLRGIEVNEYAHELAQVTVWIGYIQWLRDNGFGAPSQPILKTLDTIVRMDAVLAIVDGKPAEPTWPAADVVVGNPPFLGGPKLLRELGEPYVDTLRKLYAGRVPAGADLVTYWFERARELIARGDLQRAGLIATQAIRNGASRETLERIAATGKIFMAWPNRPWVLDGAAVRVSMVGFDNGSEPTTTFEGQAVPKIHVNLTVALDLTQAATLRENGDIAFVGSQKIGDFDIPEDEAQRLLKVPLNVNGRPNSDVVKPSVNGFDITHRGRNRWIIDFGVDMPEEDAAQYEAPYAYVEKHVYPERSANRRSSRAKRWWIHGDPAPKLRSRIVRLSRYIATARVSQHRTFVWLMSPALPDYKLVVFARDDDYFFGVLQSRVHLLWADKQSSNHGVGNDSSYTPTTTFETYPFPWPPGTEPKDSPLVLAIGSAAKRLVELRDNWLNPPGADEATLKKRTLTNLYNERPAWLDMAHKKLDAAVAAAYGWPADLSDAEILERLLKLNGERAG